MPTRSDVISMAHRRIRVLSTNESPSSDMEQYGGEVLDALFAELPASDNITFSWALDAVPQAAFLPLSYLLGVEIGPHYSMATESRATAIARLRKVMFVDDRTDRRDTDEDGIIDKDEEAAGLRALFY